MYCQNCGNDVLAETRFCQHCGAPVLNLYHEKSADAPVFILKPQHLTLAMIFKIIGWQLVFTLWSGIFFSILGAILIDAFEWNFSYWYFTGISAIIFFILTPIAYVLIILNRYTRTEYRFFKDRLEYFEGYFTFQKKHLKYRDIIEINLERGVLQRMSDIGDIIISTAATAEQQGISRSGVRFFDIQGPDLVFNQIKYLLEKKS